MENKCMSCGAAVEKELSRCNPCKEKHKDQCKALDAKPKVEIKKQPMDWVYYVKVSEGVPVRVFMTREEAQLMGKKINE